MCVHEDKASTEDPVASIRSRDIEYQRGSQSGRGMGRDDGQTTLSLQGDTQRAACHVL